MTNENHNKLDALIFSDDPSSQSQALHLIDALEDYDYLKKVHSNTENVPYCMMGILSKYGFSITSDIQFSYDYIPPFFEFLPSGTTL